jgi:hypothetical protein
MKTEGQVRQKFKQVCYRHRKKLLEKSLSRVPDNCAHNRQLDVGGTRPVGFCSLLIEDPGEWQGLVCDVHRDPELAKTCPKFRPPIETDDIKAAFKALVEDPERGLLALKYPDIAALLWVLDDVAVLDDLPEDEPVEASEQESEGEVHPEDEDAPEGKKTGFWSRFWNRS